jgi:chromosome segregation ATPase
VQTAAKPVSPLPPAAANSSNSGKREQELQDSLREEARSLTEQLKQKQAENERIGDQLRLRQIQVDKIQFENQELAKKLLNAEGSLNTLKMETARLRSEEDKYKTERKFHEERTQELNARITQLELELRVSISRDCQSINILLLQETDSLKKQLNDTSALLEASQNVCLHHYLLVIS